MGFEETEIDLRELSNECRISPKEVLAFLAENEGSSRDDIAEYCGKIPASVQRELDSLERSGKIYPRLHRIGSGFRDRECLYYLHEGVEVPQAKAKKKSKPKPPRQTPKQKSSRQSSPTPRKYFPPFVDKAGNHYPSLDAVASHFGVPKHYCHCWIRDKTLGTEGRSPTGGKQYRYYPPFRDWDGNEYSDRKEVRTAFGISESTVTAWARSGVLGHSGKSATRKIPIQHKPPFVDSSGREFASRQAVADFYNVKRSLVNNWINEGRLGSDGQPPKRKGRESRFKPPFTTRGGKTYGSREEARKALGISAKKFYNALASGAIGANGEKPSTSCRNRPITNDKKVWDSTAAAARELGWHRDSIRWRLKHKKENWRYLDEH